MKIETKCLYEGYSPKSGEPRALPIYQSTTFPYDSAEEIGELFDLESEGFFYSRLGNPTVDAVEKKIAALEGGVGALCTSSGQAASMLSLLNIMNAGDSFISASAIYGGTVNLFAVTLKKLGIECIFVDQDADADEIKSKIMPNTKAIFGETIANPAISVFDIEKFAEIAHEFKIPLIVDNTFATPILCRPFEFGADIVVHSTSKYMDGHAIQVGGVIVDSGNFDWEASGKFSDLTVPDESYHGTIYTKHFGKAAYIAKARLHLMRDMGVTPAPNSAFLLNLGLETLHLRMAAHCRNAEKVADFLHNCDKVSFVNYPYAEGDKYYQLAKKYLPNGTSGVISFSLKGGRPAALRFMKSLKLIKNEVHVAEIRTCILHPASATHRQLSDEQLACAGIDGGLIRLSVGIENVDDVIEDISQAFVNA